MIGIVFVSYLTWHLICASVAADQRPERTPRGRAKVSINAVAVDPMRPHLFVTGSSDPLGELGLHSPSKHAVECMQASARPHATVYPVPSLEACLSVPLSCCCILLACKYTKWLCCTSLHSKAGLMWVSHWTVAVYVSTTTRTQDTCSVMLVGMLQQHQWLCGFNRGEAYLIPTWLGRHQICNSQGWHR